MRVEELPKGGLELCFAQLNRRAALAGKPGYVKHLDFGTRVVRLVCHSADFIPHVEKQLTWALKDDAPRHDATLVIWRERDFPSAALAVHGHVDPANYMNLRVQKLAGRNPAIPGTEIFDEALSLHHPLLRLDVGNKVLSAWNPAANTYYYSVENLEPEEFIKHGHIFVQTFNRILKGPDSALAHGAVIGREGKGVLLCGIGYRGKSTLAVNSLLEGFDYVSDDYFVLGKTDARLRAWPIYSIITLSAAMYCKMYDRLRAKFVSNNGRKDKYVFNISEHHDRFAGGYPIAVCMYPRITNRREPSIEPGDKAIAIEELVFSTVNQMGDARDVSTIVKLHSFVDGLPFYRLNLSPDIDKNTRCLRDFLDSLNA